MIEKIKDYSNHLVDTEMDGWIAFYALCDYLDDPALRYEIAEEVWYEFSENDIDDKFYSTYDGANFEDWLNSKKEE